MFLELIAVVFAGLGAAGVVMILNWTTGGRLPRWVTPVGAGLAMLGATVASEYGWYARTSGALPDGLSIAQTVENQSFYRPWTYLAPYVDRFVALDEDTVQRNPNLPDQRLANLYFYGRWSPINRLPVLVDCADGRRASLADGASFSASGSVVDADWINAGLDDPLVLAVCAV